MTWSFPSLLLATLVLATTGCLGPHAPGPEHPATSEAPRAPSASQTASPAEGAPGIPPAEGPCAHLAEATPTALVHALHPNGTAWRDIRTSARMENRSGSFLLGENRTDEAGCVAFSFSGTATYLFRVESGSCWAMGSTQMAWNGTKHLEVEVQTSNACT